MVRDGTSLTVSCIPVQATALCLRSCSHACPTSHPALSSVSPAPPASRSHHAPVMTQELGHNLLRLLPPTTHTHPSPSTQASLILTCNTTLSSHHRLTEELWCRPATVRMYLHVCIACVCQPHIELRLPRMECIHAGSASQGPKCYIAGGVRTMGCNPIHHHTSPNLRASSAKRTLRVTVSAALPVHATTLLMMVMVA